MHEDPRPHDAPGRAIESPRVLVVDNYDSFTFNLVHALELAGARCVVVHNDASDVDALLARAVDGFMISAGPCTPDRAGVSLALARALLRPRSPDCALPLLGVCLGHQAIASACGARLRRSNRPMHGELSAIDHDGAGCFAGLPRPLRVARYNSLVVDEASLPAVLQASAWSEDGEVMGLRHRTLPVEGWQFHPESALCPSAVALLTRWVQRLRADARPSTLST